MADISYGFAFLIGTFLECVLFGIFFALLIAACYVQWDRYSKGRGVGRVVVFTIVFLGLTVTTHCVLSVYRSIRAVFYAPPGITVDEYLNPPYPTVEVFRWSLFQFQLTIADAIMAHRMYHIYGRNLSVCIVPSISITALFVVCCGMTHLLRDLSTSHKAKLLQDGSLACFSLTLFNNLYMTSAISFRLWRVHRETTRANIRVKGSVILRTMKVLIESAALWTFFVAMNFITFLAGSSLVNAFFPMTGPVAGISFCLIIVRLGQVLPESSPAESWHVSIPTPSTRIPESDGQLTDVFATDSKVDHSHSDDPPSVVRTPLTLPSPVT